MKLLTTILLALLALLAGCSSLSNVASSFGGGSESLEVQLESRPASQPLLRAGQPVRLLLPDVKDLRQSSNPRQIGRIKATVSDMHSTELLLDKDAAALTTSALRAQLTRDGFSLTPAGQPYDFELVAVIRSFELNVAGRDELNLVVEASLRASGSSDVIWAGVVSEKSDRFAGIMGNSRATITRYLGDGLANLVQKLGASVRGSLVQSYPQTLSTSSQPAPGTESASGVMTLTPASIREGVAMKAVIPAVAVPTASVPTAPPLPAPLSAPATVAPVATVKAESRPVGAPGMLPGYGYISVISMPTRVKVYSDDIYYGLTPLKAMVPVGVMTLEFRFEGYKTSREKVSVRSGETTEIEFQLKK
jgi:ABC-type uncharacterized transport system auxiliary subunit